MRRFGDVSRLRPQAEFQMWTVWRSSWKARKEEQTQYSSSRQQISTPSGAQRFIVSEHFVDRTTQQIQESPVRCTWRFKKKIEDTTFSRLLNSTIESPLQTLNTYTVYDHLSSVMTRNLKLSSYEIPQNLWSNHMGFFFPRDTTYLSVAFL